MPLPILRDRMQANDAVNVGLPTLKEGVHVTRASGRPHIDHYVDMVGVTGSIPVAPTIERPEKSSVLANVSKNAFASQCLNKPQHGTVCSKL
jgi:hypothetical protein